MLLLIAAALAAPPTVALSVTGEAVLGKAINDRFQGSSLGGQLQGTMPVYGAIQAGLTFGYRRLTGTDMAEYLWYAPIDLTAGLSLPIGQGEFFVNAGPSLVVWGSTPSAPSADGIKTGSSGGNWSVVGEFGARFPTRLVQPTLHDPNPPLRGVDVIASAGGRWSDVHKPVAHKQVEEPACSRDCALDFSAIRLNLGLAARF